MANHTANHNGQTYLWILTVTLAVAGTLGSTMTGSESSKSDISTLNTGLNNSKLSEVTEVTGLLAQDNRILVANPWPNVHNDSRDAVPSASWILDNELADTIKLHCSSQTVDLGEVKFYFDSSTSHQFPLQNTDVWTCHFLWQPLYRLAYQATIVVWAHDGHAKYLDDCTDCEWRVASGGFSYKDVHDGNFYHVYNWIPVS